MASRDAGEGTGGSATTSSTGTGGVSGGCSKNECPMSPPAAGTFCPCLDQECEYDQCPEDGALTTATCTGGAWSLQSAMCTASASCGETQCTPGFVCLNRASGIAITATCIEDPCGSSPLACSCAADVCPTSQGNTCAVMGDALYCACTICQ